MRRLCLFFILALILLSFSYPSYADLDEKIKENDISTYIKEGTRFIPLDDLARILEARLNFGISERRAFLFYQNHKISLIAGCNDVLVNGKIEKIEPPPQFIEGMFVVPLAPMKEVLASLEVSSGEEEKSVPSIKEALGPSPQSPSIETAIASSTKSTSQKVIMLDPGHGGRDPGAIGEYGLREKDVNLDIALRLNNLLAKRKELTVLMTRKDDRHLGSTSRADLGKRVKLANQKKADIFLSIHTNSARYNRWTADGFETYCPRSKAINYGNVGDVAITNEADLGVIIGDLNEGYVLEESRRLAGLIQEELSKRLITPDRGVKERNYYVLKYTEMPSVLAEIGFICNPNIEANLRDPHVRQVIAETIYKAIIRYFQEAETNWDL